MPTAKQRAKPPEAVWDKVDPLGEMLHALKMDGVVYARSHLTAPWGVDLPPMPGCLMFHVVTSGQCTLDVPGEEVLTLQPGQFALIPHGQGHRILYRKGAKCRNFFELPIERVTDRYEVLRYGGGGDVTTLICGCVKFDHPAAKDLVELLPAILHIETWSDSHAEWMHSTLRLMAAETSAMQPGGETIVTRLADILVIQAIRTWLNSNPTANTGWLGAIRDERIGPALTLMHREPTKNWTVASLADEVAMSRSAFSARFTELVGKSPLQYLTQWRMHLAGTWLREQDITLAECAGRLGYESEAAFSRAFKRVVGVAPGTWKKRQNTDQDAGVAV